MSLSAGLIAPPRRRFGWFGASLALNVFLLALLGAHLIRPALGPAAPARGDGPIGRIVEALPEPDAARMRAVLDRARPGRSAGRERVSAAQRDIAAAIARTPYDEAAVRAALAAWQARWHEFTTGYNTALIEGIGTLSDEGRARFAAAALAEDARWRRAD